MPSQIERGARVRVRATGQAGTVGSVRFAPPDFRTIQAVSVMIDEHQNRLLYAGTVYAPADLELVEETPC